MKTRKEEMSAVAYRYTTRTCTFVWETSRLAIKSYFKKPHWYKLVNSDVNSDVNYGSVNSVSVFLCKTGCSYCCLFYSFLLVLLFVILVSPSV